MDLSPGFGRILHTTDISRFLPSQLKCIAFGPSCAAMLGGDCRGQGPGMAYENVVIVGAEPRRRLRGGSGAPRRQPSAGLITLIGDENHPPYERPPLSKELLAGIGSRLRKPICVRATGTPGSSIELRPGHSSLGHRSRRHRRPHPSPTAASIPYTTALLLDHGRACQNGYVCRTIDPAHLLPPRHRRCCCSSCEQRLTPGIRLGHHRRRLYRARRSLRRRERPAAQVTVHGALTTCPSPA